MVAHVVDAVRAAGAAPVIAAGGEADPFAALGVPVVPDRVPGAGPLGGLVDALEHLTRSEPGVRSALAVSCDLPGVDTAVLEPLLAAASASFDGPRRLADVVVAVTDRRQPTCAVWHLDAVPDLRERFDAGDRSLHAVLDRLDVVEVAVPPARLVNVNTPSDLAAFVARSPSPDPETPAGRSTERRASTEHHG